MSSEAKGHTRSGVREESTVSAVLGPPLWTFAPPSHHGCLCYYQTDEEDAKLHPDNLTLGPLHSLAPGTAQQPRGQPSHSPVSQFPQLFYDSVFSKFLS